MAPERKSKVNHTPRTMEHLRKDGWLVASVEKKAPMPAMQPAWIEQLVRAAQFVLSQVSEARVKQELIQALQAKDAWRGPMAFNLTVTVDLFGSIDLLAIRGAETLGIQLTSDAHHATRRKKIFQNPEMRRWLEGGTRRLEVWSWKKVGHRWQPRVEPISLDMLDPEFVQQPVSRGTDGEDW